VNAPTGRTYERKRSDQIIKEFLQGGAVHIWHLDEVVITIKGERHFLWRAVDQDAFVLEVLVQKRRDTKAAKHFIRKLLSGQGAAPRVMVTDKLGSTGPPTVPLASPFVIIASIRASTTGQRIRISRYDGVSGS
jgi:transposase-like protein